MIIAPFFGNGFLLYNHMDEDENPLPDDITVILSRYLKDHEPEISIEDLQFEELSDIFHTDDSRFFDFSDRFGMNNDHEITLCLTNRTTENPRILFAVDMELPTMYDSPYPSKTAYLQAVKDKIKDLGLLSYLPEDFDWESHTGNYYGCATCI